jgi:hypothetical protein
MSLPKNHHYVSQCHIRNFFNSVQNKIYCYDKELDNHYSKQSSKKLFSEDYSNTRLINGELDHQTLEDELNLNFEQDFDKHVCNILELTLDALKNDDKKLESLYYVICYALVSDVRLPANKRKADDAINSAFRDIVKIAKDWGDEASAASIEKSLDKNRKTKYSNLVSYTEVAEKRLGKMGDLNFLLIKINSQDIFILPDSGSFHARAKINKYFNPDVREVAMVGIPLTEKLFVFGFSKKLLGSESGIVYINDTNSSVVHEINTDLFNNAIKTVASGDEGKLREIIDRIKAANKRN